MAPTGAKEFVEKITPEEINRLRRTLKEELDKDDAGIDSAYAIAERLRELGVSDDKSRIMIAVAYIRKGRKTGNKNFIRKAVEILKGIDKPVAHYNLGIAYYELDELDKAEKEFKKSN